MMTVQQAIDSIYNDYDAFYITNKYGDGTHGKEFGIIIEATKGDSKAVQAIGWIKNCYDCYYKADFAAGTGTAFDYLKDSNERND